MFSLPTVREAIFTSHARVAGGRDGTRKDRSTGWLPQTHSGHVVSRTSHSTPRFHEINCAGRKRLSIIHCPHDFRRRPCKACHQLRHNLDISHNQAYIMVQSGALPALSVPGPYVLASILASGRVGEPILGPPYIPSYGGRVGEFHMTGPDHHD